MKSYYYFLFGEQAKFEEKKKGSNNEIKCLVRFVTMISKLEDWLN